MSEFNVSSRYANALISLSEDKNILDRVYQDVDIVFNTIKASKELRNVLESPILEEEKKSSILDEIFKKDCCEETLKFIRFVVSKGRESILFDISNRFIDIMNDRLGKIELEVVSAVELTEDQKVKMENKLEELTNKKVLVEYLVEDSIIGGFKVKVKDTVFDASIKQQLVTLKDKLLSEAV